MQKKAATGKRPAGREQGGHGRGGGKKACPNTLAPKTPAQKKSARQQPESRGSDKPAAPGSPVLSEAGLRERAARVLEGLFKRYPVRETHLAHNNVWELLVATVLAAQCTDLRVNTVTPLLFSRWPGPEELAVADIAEVEAVVRPTGFYHNKAKNIVGAARRVMEVYHGRVPESMEELITLPGVARKTANVVLWGGFGKNEGIAVDTHVGRIALRLGLTENRDPVQAERVLMRLLPREHWGDANHMLVWFGRHVCDARKPLCDSCEFAGFCPKAQLEGKMTFAENISDSL